MRFTRKGYKDTIIWRSAEFASFRSQGLKWLREMKTWESKRTKSIQDIVFNKLNHFRKSTQAILWYPITVFENHINAPDLLDAFHVFQ